MQRVGNLFGRALSHDPSLKSGTRLGSGCACQPQILHQPPNAKPPLCLRDLPASQEVLVKLHPTLILRFFSNLTTLTNRVSDLLSITDIHRTRTAQTAYLSSHNNGYPDERLCGGCRRRHWSPLY